MKQVWSINEAGQRPVLFYTSRKKALKMAKTLLECDGFTVEIKLNGKRVAFADGYKGNEIKCYYIYANSVS
jgi:hypothetical protein